LAPNTMGDPLERNMIFRRCETGELDVDRPSQTDLGGGTPLVDPLQTSEQDRIIDLEPFGRDIA